MTANIVKVLRRAAGFSTLEMVVSMSILLIVITMAMPLVTKSFDLLSEHESRAAVDANVQIAMRQLTRDVRSGNVIGSPYAVNSVAGMGVRIYTQTDGVPFRCVEYQVLGTSLLRRDRDPDAEWTENWSTVVTDVTNATAIPTSPAFTRSADKSTLAVTMVLDPAGSARPVEATVSITGRNTKYYDTPFAEDTCE